MPKARSKPTEGSGIRSNMTPADTLIIIVIAALGVGGAKLVYAFLADRARVLLNNSGAARGLNLLAAGIMVAVGVVLLLKTGNLI